MLTAAYPTVIQPRFASSTAPRGANPRRCLFLSSDSSLPPSFDTTLVFWGTIAPGWQVREPLTATLEQDDDGTFIISEDRFLVFGYGNSIREAQQDFVEALTDYYSLLAKHGDPPTLRLFDCLKRVLSPQ